MKTFEGDPVVLFKAVVYGALLLQFVMLAFALLR